MGVGMAEFLDEHVTSEQEWDKYCHYVAGLLGIGLSHLFLASQFEDPLVGEDVELANSMGLFLQKTTIIRDYLEDQREGREFWPQEVWSRYVKKLEDFAKPENIDLAVQCLNELVTNALHHIPDVLTYLSRLRNQSVFNFCAIPEQQVVERNEGHASAQSRMYSIRVKKTGPAVSWVLLPEKQGRAEQARHSDPPSAGGLGKASVNSTRMGAGRAGAGRASDSQVRLRRSNGCQQRPRAEPAPGSRALQAGTVPGCSRSRERGKRMSRHCRPDWGFPSYFT
ncbi:Squalene synthase [Tupaia chinensis]|uniref:Squalene synthase n=1 Tax=Tupaia chinensis TaxID=246437 RepID=L9KH33_TUPCH|nr:Squalene synthase [Tupaia chinensis]